jgi:K+-sensing histidine kinase KdpD
VAAEGQILLHAADHGAAGRMVAEYANAVRATTIVIGAPSHGRVSAGLDESMSREVLRAAQSNVLIVNPDAPVPFAAPASAAPASAAQASAAQAFAELPSTTLSLAASGLK